MSRKRPTPIYRGAGFGQGLAGIQPARRRDQWEYTDDETERVSESLCEPVRRPDAIDAALPGALALAMDKLTSMRERNLAARRRREGYQFAAGQADYRAEEDARADGPEDAEREALVAWLNEDGDEEEGW